MKLLLANLGTTLLNFHRALLQTQKDIVQKEDNKTYSPYELLNLSLNDSRFAWLKQFSDLIVQIDMIVDDKKNTPFDIGAIANSVRAAVSPENLVTKEFRAALSVDSSLMLGLGHVRLALSEIDKAHKAEMN